MTDILTVLSNTFYLISSAMLIPVMLGLLLGLMLAFLYLGRAIREFVARIGFAEERNKYAAQLERAVNAAAVLSARGGMLSAVLNKMQQFANDPLVVDKLAAETESQWQAQLEKLQTWVRFGPAIGLMGTLIPLGPGLLALAAGDLKTLSDSLIIAFATTVVGVLISLIFSGIYGVRKRWYRDDAVLLNFTAERMKRK